MSAKLLPAGIIFSYANAASALPQPVQGFFQERSATNVNTLGQNRL
jgi:hypothetical protein